MKTLLNQWEGKDVSLSYDREQKVIGFHAKNFPTPITVKFESDYDVSRLQATLHAIRDYAQTDSRRPTLEEKLEQRLKVLEHYAELNTALRLDLRDRVSLLEAAMKAKTPKKGKKR